jgi:hypothetical protein
MVKNHVKNHVKRKSLYVVKIKKYLKKGKRCLVVKREAMLEVKKRGK